MKLKSAKTGGNAALVQRRAGVLDDRRTDAIFGIRQGMQLLEIDVARTHPRPDQPRRHFDEQQLEELAASMGRVKLLQPIIVAMDGAGGFTIVAGERRWRAAQRLGWNTISAIVAPDDADPQEIALLENIQRSQLTPLEEADAVIRLQERNGWTQEETAAALGKSRIHVTEMARLTRLPAWLREEYAGHVSTISAGLLLEIGLAKTEKMQALLWERAKEGTLTVAEARRIRTAEGKPTLSPPSPASRSSPLAKAMRSVLRLNQDLAEVEREKGALDAAARNELIALRQRIDAILG